MSAAVADATCPPSPPRRALFVECGVRPASLEEEAEEIRACFRSFRSVRSAPGDAWCVGPSAWWFEWADAAAFHSAGDASEQSSRRPPASQAPLGPIDTQALLLRFAPAAAADRPGGAEGCCWSAAPILRPALQVCASLAPSDTSLLMCLGLWGPSFPL